MKNRMFVGLVAAATALVLSSSLAAAEDFAYSANAIGVIKKTLPAKKMVCMSLPLDQDPISDGTNVIDGVRFSDIPGITNLPSGTSANFWDVENQKWIPQVKTDKSGWGNQKNRVIKSGEAFFLSNAQDSDLQLVLSGEVPADDSIPVAFAANALSSVANPYPVPMAFSTFAFASDLPSGSSANFWDEANQKWIPQVKTDKTGWGSQKNREIQPGEGFFILAATEGYIWVEPRRYSWPNTTED